MHLNKRFNKSKAGGYYDVVQMFTAESVPASEVDAGGH
jgi:hypothetical protein